MPSLSIGDGVQHFLNARHNSQLRNRLNILTEELASGRVHDVSKRLGGDSGRFAAIERSLQVLNGFELVTAETQQSLAMMQTSLDQVDNMRVSLAGHLIPINSDSSAGDRSEAATAAKNAFGAIVGTLNTRLAGRSLFSGAAVDQTALAPPDTILAEIAIAAAGATDAAGVIAAVDAWFDTVGGGFETAGFLGDTGAEIERRADANHKVNIPAKADDPAIRAVLKAVAIGALSESFGALPPDEAALLARHSGEALMSAGQGIAQVQARLGGVEARLEEVKTSQTAQRTALSLLRNDMVSADPYETASALQEVQLQLETHYTLTARLSRLSLTEYMR